MDKVNHDVKDKGIPKKSQYYVRKMYYQESLMINICDEELLGKKISSGSLNIDITKDYFVELMDEKQIQDLLKKCSIANLIGKRVIQKTLEWKLAKKDSIKNISSIPFLMIYKFTKNY
jgi:hypothetical protein